MLFKTQGRIKCLCQQNKLYEIWTEVKYVNKWIHNQINQNKTTEQYKQTSKMHENKLNININKVK